MIPMAPGFFKPISGGCWSVNGRTGFDLGSYTLINSPGIFTQQSDGLDIRGTEPSPGTNKYGAVRFDGRTTLEDGDVTFSLASDWTANLAPPVYGADAFIAFGDTTIGSTGTTPVSDFSNVIQIAVYSTATTGYVTNSYINGSSHGGVTPDVNDSWTWAKATFAEARVVWRNGIGVYVYIDDVLVYQAESAGFTFEDAPIYFGSYTLFTITDGWTTFRDITACPYGVSP